ncbi:hypothetical protein JCM3766R1_001307 [Sporobolomyces carnicolor]
MSYNGIGLSTPRGSGTSGHIQANRSNLRSRPQQQPRDAVREQQLVSSLHRQPDQAILDHERKRRVEAKCFELRCNLEDEGLVEPDEIERQVDQLRSQLLAQATTERPGGGGDKIKQSDRHELARAKQVQDEKLRRALGIKPDHVEGLAFDRDAQQELKRQRQEERERQRVERDKAHAELKRQRDLAFEQRRTAAAAASKPLPYGRDEPTARETRRPESIEIPISSSSSTCPFLLAFALATSAKTVDDDD